LIVGISRSRASWWALSWAIGEARRRGARLLLVHVFRPRFLLSPEIDPYFASVRQDPDADRVADGNTLIWAAIDQAVGQMPRDVAFEEVILPGRPAVELARLARGGDVLVLGSRHRGWLRRLAPGSVARACARRADCPVVTVPEPSPSALTAALPADSVRGHRHRWMPHREARIAGD
jgi:nucleotide-binding universal stress UspA family protein